MMRIAELSLVSVICAKRETKMSFLVIFIDLTHRFDLIIHILIVLNGPRDFVMVVARFCMNNYAKLA